MNTPPFAWSDFIAEDSGSCNPRFVRSTLGHVPASKEVLRETKLPLAVIVTPLAKLEAGERETMVVDFGEEGPPRCGRCRGYVNKFSRWNTSDGGRSWSCNLCGLVNETPQWYQCHNGVDQYGDRNDKHERPELMFGSVEFTAPSSYLVEGRNPTPLSVAFIIDVSLPALTSGLLQAASTAILSAIPALEQSSGGQARVGIIVYDSEIHFFDMKSKKGDGSISQATVCDVNEAFCPLSLSQWTGSLSEPGTRPQLELLLSRLPSLFQANVTRPKQSVSGAALKAAVEGLGDSGGRIVMFQAQLPLSGEGSLQV
jgi:protein transport protein SEC24